MCCASIVEGFRAETLFGLHSTHATQNCHTTHHEHTTYNPITIARHAVEENSDHHQQPINNPVTTHHTTAPMPPDEISPQQNSPQNGIHPSGASDSSLEAPEPSHNSTLENITNLAGTILTELPLELPALEFFYEAPSEVLSDDGSVAEPQRIASQSQLVKAEVNKLLDEYEELDVGNLDESVRSSLKRLLRHVIAQQRKPKRVKLRDKILFVLGTCDLWCVCVCEGGLVGIACTHTALGCYQCVFVCDFICMRVISYVCTHMHITTSTYHRIITTLQGECVLVG